MDCGRATSLKDGHTPHEGPCATPERERTRYLTIGEASSESAFGVAHH